jgi:metallo-beta-lactamase family protein
MRITFLGAAGTVTGSKYLIEHNQYRILVDCGLFQGLKELRLKNWADFPVDPKSIDIVLLTHAHIDHSGYLPLLVKNGFKGDILCSKATYDLCRVLLPDSGYLQEEDAKRANKYHYSKHQPALPLYTEQDAIMSLKSFKFIDFNQNIHLFPKVSAYWRHAGHILGAAFIELKIEDETIAFSGDLGRFCDPIMNPPERPHKTSTLIIESTYGNRLHGTEDPLNIMANTINKTIQQQGTVVIPAFAVGRTQAIMYYLDQLILHKKIPNLPIYLDSPMAIDATKILQKHLSEHQLSKEDCARICNRVRYINSPEESKQIDNNNFPKIILSASGMMTGGRILHHLKYFGPDPKSTILITGFQAAGTRGSRLLNHETHLKIHGEMIPIRAKIVDLTATSAHADYNELLNWISLFPSLPKRIFITHGEPKSALELQKHIENKFHIKCIIPKYLESFSWK